LKNSSLSLLTFKNMGLPDYIDNRNINLETVLRQIIEEENQLCLDIATGYFRIEAWLRLEQAMNKLQSLRLLIGRDPSIRPAESDRIDLIKYYRNSLKNQIENQPFVREYQQQIDRIINYLLQEHIEVRLYGALGENNKFLHAKAYIFDEFSIVGSSNFTPNGLKNNSELNIINKSISTSQNLRNEWFERFWNDPSVDINYKQKLIETLNASKFGSKAYTPYQIFLKALYELFKEDTIVGESNHTGVELASFQQEGFVKAVRLIERHRGCIVADAVGLGKTYIGLRVIEHYLIKDRKPRHIPKAVVICPAQLRDLVWSRKLDEFGLKADILSHEEISRKTFDIRKYSHYDIVVIDEGHNFRNSATNRYENLLKLLSSGNRNKRVLILTATPINNSIYDLYHQILLITKGDENYYREWGISNLKTFFQGLYKGNKEITELLFQTMVRRSRQDVISRQQAGEEIRIGGKLIHFPQRQLEQFTYNFEDEYKGLYSGIATQIDLLNLSPYNIKSFKLKKIKLDETEIKRNRALVYLQKALYFKRFESSLIAFKKTITNQRNFQLKFSELLTKQGKLLDSKNFRKLILAWEDEEETNTVEDIINQLEEINAQEYNLVELAEHIKSDLNILNNILSTIEKIESSTEHYDQKLIAFKQLLTSLQGQKILVFSYYQDTAKYLYQELKKDTAFLAKINNPNIDIITGDTSGQKRQEKVNHFAPKANVKDPEELPYFLDKPIDILICTDVLSEGQNLQDAGILINYDLHWNPVRMIQRAGRIDRLGTEYNTLYIYNCFPEQGLDDLLGLVRRLQERIATIDKEVGLDGSVLGEIISGRSIEQLERLKKADTDAEKQAILEELEAEVDLVSLDEMRLPLIEFLQQQGQELVEEIPLGIHSTRHFNIPEPQFKEGGVFLAFKSEDKHFWYFYPRISGFITTAPDKMITDKRKIFNWLKCKLTDFPSPETLKPVKFNNAIFAIIEPAIDQILTFFTKQQTGAKVSKKLNKIEQKIVTYLQQNQSSLLGTEIETDTMERILKVIKTIILKSVEKEIKRIWTNFTEHKQNELLCDDLDLLFSENDYYNQIEEELTPLKIIKREDIQLVCFEWFYPILDKQN
jgi:superfamily II DNA or RNA helicase/uncharacterized protein YqgV (UPF0045/DUF77 family)